MGGFAEYPITVAETTTYQKDADELFTNSEHDRLRDYLAFHPVAGDPIVGAEGVRQLFWLTKKGREAQVIYFFRDLNMPLYLLAVYAEGKAVEFDNEWREEMARFAEALVTEHRRGAVPKAVPESSA